MFKKLFSKKEGITTYSNSIENQNSNSKFSNELKSKIEKSRLQLMTHELFMHYWSENLKEDSKNPEWQNQAVFFWKFKEPFEKKSLPPSFKNIQEKYFIVNQIPDNTSIAAGQVMPWFGMPGGGMKYYFQNEGTQIQINKLANSNAITYVDVIELSDLNSEYLTKTESCYFLMDTNVINFSEGKFFYNQKEIQFSDAVENGSIQLICFKN